MDKPIAILHQYIMERSVSEPVHVRVQLYEALAKLTTDKDAKELRSLATTLREADHRAQQLCLNFRLRA